MEVVTIRRALVRALNHISGLEFYATVPDAPIVPCVIVYPDSITYHEMFDGLSHATFVLHILGAAADTIDGQETLDAYLASSGPLSIKEAIDLDSTLGGAVGAAWVTELREYGTVQPNDGGSRFYSAQLMVEVHAS